MPAPTIHCSVRYTVARPMPDASARIRSKRSSALICPFCRRNTCTILSRFDERLPPSGRKDVRSGRVVSCRSVDGEGLAAAAGGRGVRVLDREAAAGDGVDEVDLGAVQIADADRIDEELHAVRLEYLVAGTLAVLFDHQPVLEARAAAALDEYAQAAARLVF